jgi:hypothetical protein
MQRLIATILLIVLMVTSALPLPVGRWECLDGTPCRFAPASSAQVAARSPENVRDCCRKPTQTFTHSCDHGWLPVAPVKSSAPPHWTAAGNSPRCQFVAPKIRRANAVLSPTSPTLHVDAAILSDDGILHFSPHAIALPREDFFPRAREGLTPRASRAPPLA